MDGIITITWVQLVAAVGGAAAVLGPMINAMWSALRRENEATREECQRDRESLRSLMEDILSTNKRLLGERHGTRNASRDK